MMRETMIISLIGVSLSACADQRDRYQTGIREPISLRDDGDECGSTLVQTYVGLRANQTVREEVTRRSGASVIRWIDPGMAVTEDFSPARLNAELDSDGVVTRIRCG
ncbi:MAG: I78 family peptidase inhibitor [Sphingopyxis sp.]